VLQFTRVKVTMMQASWPIQLNSLLAVLGLTFWTIFSGFGWVRTEVDEETGESFGRCASPTNESWFFFCQVFLSAVPVFFAFSMAWKTKDVDDSFSESWWIFALIFVQLQVRHHQDSCLKYRLAHAHMCLMFFRTQTSIVAIPLFFILRDLSTDGRHIGLVLLVWVFSVSTVLLIMLPKILAVYGIYGGKARAQTRGSIGNVRISGLMDAEAATRLNSRIRREGVESMNSTTEESP
jgi:hypothetical protein